MTAAGRGALTRLVSSTSLTDPSRNWPLASGVPTPDLSRIPPGPFAGPATSHSGRPVGRPLAEFATLECDGVGAALRPRPVHRGGRGTAAPGIARPAGRGRRG